MICIGVVKGSVTNFVSLVIKGSNLVRIRYISYQEGAFYYGDNYCLLASIENNYDRLSKKMT